MLAVGIDGLRALGLTSEDFARPRIRSAAADGASWGRLGVTDAATPWHVRARGQAQSANRRGKSRAHLIDELGPGSFGVADHVLGIARRLWASQRLWTAYGDRDDVGAALEPLREYMSLRSRRWGSAISWTWTSRSCAASLTTRASSSSSSTANAELRAICGGGRYDRLLELVGGEALPGSGIRHG